MVAHALHHGPRAGVAHREALAGEAPEEGPAGGRTVEDGVADDYVLLGLEVLAHAVARTDREDAPREALARVVLRVAAQREGDAGSEPAGEALPGGPLEVHDDRVLGEPLGAVAAGHVA